MCVCNEVPAVPVYPGENFNQDPAGAWQLALVTGPAAPLRDPGQSSSSSLLFTFPHSRILPSLYLLLSLLAAAGHG